MSKSMKSLKSGKETSSIVKPLGTYNLLKDGKVVTLQRNAYYEVKVANIYGIVQIERLWLEHEECVMLLKFYVQPKYVKQLQHKLQFFGEDEVVQYKNYFKMTTRQFRKCYNTKNKPDKIGFPLCLPEELLELNFNGKLFYCLKTFGEDATENYSNNVKYSSLNIPMNTLNTLIKHGNEVDMKQFKAMSLLNIDNYDSYCTRRKLLKLLDTGGCLHQNEVQRVTSTTEARLLFTKETFANDTILTNHCGQLYELLQDTNTRKRKFDVIDPDDRQDQIDDNMYMTFKMVDMSFYEAKIAAISKRKRKKHIKLLKVFNKKEIT